MPELNRRGFVGLGASLVASGVLARSGDLVVSKSGRPGTVANIAAAVALARETGRRRVRIEPGLYVEKTVIDLPGLELIGAGRKTIISFGAAAGFMAPDGKKWGTGRSATLTIDAPDVSLRSLTIRNSFDFIGDRASGASGGGSQAVALSLAGRADRNIIRDCTIESYQDSFYLHAPGRAYVRDCLISGNVDFIFGGATALFDQCEIRSRFVPGMEVQGFVAAPSTPADVPVGFVFDHCRLTREAGLPRHSVYLGRPWRAGGNMKLTGFAAYVDCCMDDHVHPDGWTSMHYTNPAGVRTQLTPQEARLFEARSKGPGAGPARPTRRLMADDAASRLTKMMFGGWRPA